MQANHELSGQCIQFDSSLVDFLILTSSILFVRGMIAYNPKNTVHYMPNPIMSLNENKHRANCNVPFGECGECMRILGFPLLAEKLENFDKGYNGGQ
jgi:hypothetical protein